MTDADKPAAEPAVSPDAPAPDTLTPEMLASIIEPGKSYKALAIVSLVLALIGLFISSLVLDPIAIILGLIARHKMRAANNDDGRGVALAGIIIGIFGTVVPLILLIIRTHHP
jgi:hypothetical protein